MTELKPEKGKAGASKPSVLSYARQAGLDGFILVMVLIILLAWIWPRGGDANSPLHLAEIANYGVSLIFFFYGLRLSTSKLKAGLSNWPLHLLVHVTTFVIFPILVLAGKFLFESTSDQLLWLAVFFLATLPSTVSSSVVMVSIAGGNIPAAIFNASISSLMGVFLTPLWMSIFLTAVPGGFDLGPAVGKLGLQVLVPVALGMLMHSKWGSFAERYRTQLRYFDQSIILLIVYTSFCESFTQNVFRGFTLVDIVLLGAAMIALFILVFALVRFICRVLRFTREDSITALFCGSKKSLVHGTVMANVLFAGSEILGIILLPLMLYHALQLVASSIIAQRLARQ